MRAFAVYAFVLHLAHVHMQLHVQADSSPPTPAARTTSDSNDTIVRQSLDRSVTFASPLARSRLATQAARAAGSLAAPLSPRDNAHASASMQAHAASDVGVSDLLDCGTRSVAMASETQRTTPTTFSGSSVAPDGKTAGVQSSRNTSGTGASELAAQQDICQDIADLDTDVQGGSAAGDVCAAGGSHGPSTCDLDTAGIATLGHEDGSRAKTKKLGVGAQLLRLLTCAGCGCFGKGTH